MKTNISQGSVATPLDVVGPVTLFYCKFFPKYSSERILKIGQYLVKLWTRLWCRKSVRIHSLKNNLETFSMTSIHFCRVLNLHEFISTVWCLVFWLTCLYNIYTTYAQLSCTFVDFIGLHLGFRRIGFSEWNVNTTSFHHNEIPRPNFSYFWWGRPVVIGTSVLRRKIMMLYYDVTVKKQ